MMSHGAGQTTFLKKIQKMLERSTLQTTVVFFSDGTSFVLGWLMLHMTVAKEKLWLSLGPLEFEVLSHCRIPSNMNFHRDAVNLQVTNLVK